MADYTGTNNYNNQNTGYGGYNNQNNGYSNFNNNAGYGNYNNQNNGYSNFNQNAGYGNYNNQNNGYSNFNNNAGYDNYNNQNSGYGSYGNRNNGYSNFDSGNSGYANYNSGNYGYANYNNQNAGYGNYNNQNAGYNDYGNAQGYGFGPFGNDGAAQNDFYGGYNNVGPTGMQGLMTIVTERVVAKSFLFMVAALIITAVSAMAITPMTAYTLVSGGGFFAVIIAELAIVFISNAAIRKNNAILAGILYTVYSILTGITFSIIFMAYTAGSIATTFFITASVFAIMAVIGLVTKKDLTSLGSLFMMGLIGVIIASLVNLFLGNPMVDMLVSIVAIVIFVGLTAYDTQKIKASAQYSTTQSENCLALMGAFQLYLDFINIFLKLLRILGRRK
ncbi:MAG: Bax inhibitor-1 family protein [Lachnospiraceae bacterium]|nr:Bax inhibitor-1 family protein [Lachnospiraceae bacterium]